MGSWGIACRQKTGTFVRRIIKIAGFKSIHSCDISLGQINVLIGGNGAGKSNFLAAFSFLQNVLNQNLQVAAAQSGLHALLYNGGKETDEIAFEVYFGNCSYGFILVLTEDNRLVFQKESFGYHGDWESERIVGSGYGEARWREGTHSKLDDCIIPILEKQNWSVYHFHDTGRSAKVKQEHNIANSLALMHDAGNLAAFLYRLKRNYRKNYDLIVQTIQLVAPFFSDFVLAPQEYNNKQIVLKWRQKGCEDICNASQLSDGTLRFICLTTLLLQPHELQPPTIIIDEPELGLHPCAITLLAEMVGQVSVYRQIILSTQSTELLDAFDVKDVLVVDRRENGSALKHLDEEELAFWRKEDYALGELWKKNLLGGRP